MQMASYSTKTASSLYDQQLFFSLFLRSRSTLKFGCCCWIKLYPQSKPTSEPNSFHSTNTLLLFHKTFFDVLNCLHYLLRFLVSPLFPIPGQFLNFLSQLSSLSSAFLTLILPLPNPIINVSKLHQKATLPSAKTHTQYLLT